MGAVYSHADSRLSTLMHRECMGGYVHVKTESYRHRYNLESRGKRVGKSVNRRIIISVVGTPGGLGMSRGDGECYGTRTLKES